MPQVLQDIKDELDARIGQTITVVAQAGRKKTTTRTGTLVETYNSLFVVELDEAEDTFDRVSYSYTDVYTHHIEVEYDVATASQTA
ncbi:MAG: hypothetical protein LBM27_01540 [Lactobacillaceae bacterium]|jgi:uncharacterized protein Veg|nr:hypothetical protein [Lactobacillaceae bacterium]